jgi:MATE family multidrug resistance protein
LAAVAVGASIWVPVFLFMTGMLMSATSVLARHVGAKQLQRVNPLVHQVVTIAVAAGVIAAVLLCNTGPLLEFMDVDPAMRPLVLEYLFGLSWGMPAIALVLALRSYTEALSHTRPVLLISVIGLLINIPVNYVLIYGKLGIPAMGGVGCGWATAIVMWLMAAMLLVYVHRHRAYKAVRLSISPWHWEPRTIAYLLKLGLPVGMTIFFEVSVFCIIALFISQAGAEIVAGHQLTLNFTSLLFMLPLSFALAATTRVGLARGADDAEGLNRAVKVSFKITLCIGCSAAVMLILLKNWIPLIYTDNATVIALASYLLLFAALYQISDAIQVTANGCLRGFEDTSIPMVLTLFAYWGVGLPLGYTLAMSDALVPAMGPSGFWLGLFAGLSSAALLLGLRLRWRLNQPLH